MPLNWIDDISKSIVKTQYPNKYGAQKDADVIFKTSEYLLYKRPYVEKGNKYNVYVTIDKTGKLIDSKTTIKLIKISNEPLRKFEIRKKAIWMRQ